MRLHTGELWPIPIVLPIDAKTRSKLKHEKTVILKDICGKNIARLFIEDVYKPNLSREYREVYGTEDENHPYVSYLKSLGEVWYLGGKVVTISPPDHYDFEKSRLSPEQLKIFFAENGWTQHAIVGFQTRNPMHRSHIELTKYALKQTGDPEAKLLLHPIVGVTQEGDISYHTRVRCYNLILGKYPEGTVKLSLLPLSMRMAGPREALWHALIRKNYGCTHFIVGRDHAGPSVKTKEGNPFYEPYAAHKLLDQFKSELGIKIIRAQNIVYVEELGEYLPLDEVPEGNTTLTISGTELRRRLQEDEEIPEWFSYPEVVQELKQSFPPLNKRGFCVYFVGLSGSGKSTIANAVRAKLQETLNRPITILDGDIIRKNLSTGLGFTREDRSVNVRRIGFVASEIVKHRGIVFCANIAPYKEDREWNRKLISQYGGYIEVFVDTPIEVCEERDVKGLYKLARKGLIKQFTGVSDTFERPQDPELTIRNYQDLQKAVIQVVDKLIELGYVDGPKICRC